MSILQLWIGKLQEMFALVADEGIDLFAAYHLDTDEATAWA